MRSVTGVFGLALAVAIAGCATEETYPRTGPRADAYTSHTASEMSRPVTGRVVHVDVPQQVVVLEGGQMYRVTGDRAVLVDGRPAVLTTVRPGSTVTIVQGTPVRLQDGRYVVAAPGTPAGTVVVPETAPRTSTVVVPARTTGAQYRLYGRVEEVEQDGDVKVKAGDNTFEFRAPPGHTLREGDTVTIDVTQTPPGVPAASPR
ncbi:MAG TPA: hypothetical protein VNN07_01290 [Candidatus Tectomicrobia bacterium]|nr:hypothetical protein [Candidatus Tectomicrobia bacterium]